MFFPRCSSNGARNSQDLRVICKGSRRKSKNYVLQYIERRRLVALIKLYPMNRLML